MSLRLEPGERRAYSTPPLALLFVQLLLLDDDINFQVKFCVSKSQRSERGTSTSLALSLFCFCCAIFS
uniref:Uncharacterized protein n=1 Tax=Octopus bimaculoides TaxID=37653 RepID=A0A0L8H3V8_OCTBM